MSPTHELLVAAIKDGTVIDHITAGYALRIIMLLRLAAHQKVVTVGLNLPSRAMGRKDLIKIEGRELSPEEANGLAILSPHATINIIRDYKTTKKFAVELPKKIVKIITCPNLKCITNHERMNTLFDVVAGKENKLHCHYCEKIFGGNEITGYKI